MLLETEPKPKKPKLSTMMIALYGEDEASAVYDRCQAVDPWFNEYVQRVIYDEIWALPPLTLRQKSLITIVTLATLQKEEQLQIHLKGYFNLGGRKEDITTLFNYMLKRRYVTSLEKLLAVLQSIKIKPQRAGANNDFLGPHNKALIDLAALIATGDNKKTKEFLVTIMQDHILEDDEIRGALRHVMTYSGCPCTMNGFAVLKEIKETELTPRCKL